MKIKNMLKYSSLAALVLTVAVGCASAPKEEPAAAPTAEEQAAMAAQTDAQNAIDAAKAAIEKAKAEGALWNDTENLVAQAEQAMQSNDFALAKNLADKARLQAENALAQHQSEMAKMGGMTMGGGADNYTVVRGDSLWGISGKSEVYGNPYQWPLIYKANRDKIKDADLIYPGQVFAIDRAASAADIAAAVNHAKTRGAWSLGKVEASDKAYLAK